MNEREIAQLMIEENPEPIIKNPYLKSMFGGGRAEFKRGSGNPIQITDELLNELDRLIKTTNKTLKQIGRDLGYEADLRSDSYLIKAYEKKRGKIPSERFKSYKLANDPEYVKKVGDEVKRSSIQATAEKRGVDRKTIKNILNQEAPHLRGKTNIAGPTTGAKELKKRRLEIIKDLKKYWKSQKGGDLILEEMDKKLAGIAQENQDILKMSDDAIWGNKKYQDAMRLDVKALKTGEGLKFDRYQDISKKDFAKSVRDLAAKGEFVQPEHIIPIKARDPDSLLAKNIFPAYGKVGGQMEALKDFSKANTMGKRPTEVFNFLKGQNIPIEKPGFWKTTKKVGSKAGRFLFGPVEMGVLPLAIAAEGVYSNYASVRDLRKALDEDPTKTDEEKELIVRAYAQENVDRGDVGLEDWALEQKDTTGIKEELMKMDLDMPTYQRAMNTIISEWRGKEAEKKRRLDELQRQRTKEAWERATGRQTGGIVGIKLR